MCHILGEGWGEGIHIDNPSPFMPALPYLTMARACSSLARFWPPHCSHVHYREHCCTRQEGLFFGTFATLFLESIRCRPKLLHGTFSAQCSPFPDSCSLREGGGRSLPISTVYGH